MRRRSRSGTVLLIFAACLAVLIGVAALVVDVGRMYIAKSEVQTFTDAASLAATLQLDGTQAGLSRARSAATNDSNKWNFGTRTFSGTTVDFSKDPTGPFEAAPASAADYRCARVSAAVDVPLTFAMLFQREGALSGAPVAMLAWTRTTRVRAISAGAQVSQVGLSEGLFPFSPYAHDTVAPHFGLMPGQQYTLRWASNPKKNHNVCAGDNTDAMIALAEAGGGEERGYIEETSSDVIRRTIEGDAQTIVRYVGDIVNMTGGAKQTHLTSIVNRVNQDTDITSATYAQYTATATGNGRRIVAVPINNGYPENRIVQIGAFLLLLQNEYTRGGNNPFCAEYIGSYIFGANHKAVAPAGAYVARLVQ